MEKLIQTTKAEAHMFYRDQLDDDYEKHQRQTRYLRQDELDPNLTDARVSGPPWYASILTRLGDGLITAGRSLKDRNHATPPAQTRHMARS